MGVGRKLYIDDEGFKSYCNSIYQMNVEAEHSKFADIIECTDKVMTQLKFASRLHKIQSISILKSGDIRFRTTDLFISNSETGKLRKFFIGKWVIEINCNAHLKFKPVNRAELGFSSGVWAGNNNTVHPHISGRTNEACLGNASTPITMYVQSGDIKALAIYLLGFLESVNIQDTAGVWLGSCKEVAIDEEGNPLHDEDGNYKFISNEFTDIPESYRCISKYTNTLVDIKHHEYITSVNGCCVACKNSYNKPHLSFIDEFHNIYACDECKDKIRVCDCCKSIVNDIAYDKDGIVICDNCAKAYLTMCNFCNEYIIPDDITLEKNNVKRQLESIVKVSKENKNNSYIYLNDDGDVKHVFACDDCKQAIQNTEVSNKIITLSKQKVGNEYASIIKKDIPINTILVKCATCGNYHYIENILHVPREGLLCANCANRVGYKPAINEYVNLVFNFSENKTIVKSISNIDTSEKLINYTILPVSLLKDKDKWIDKDIGIATLEYKDGKFATSKVYDVCERCGRKIPNEEKYCMTKQGNILCNECAKNTFTRCGKCGKILPINKLARNVGYVTQDRTECVTCYLNDNAIEVL